MKITLNDTHLCRLGTFFLKLLAFLLTLPWRPTFCMDVNDLKVEALGRLSNIGNIYDERTETFLNDFIFNQTLLPSEVITTKNESTNDTRIKHAIVTNFQDRFELLNIDAGKLVSILAGQLKIKKGAFNFLSHGNGLSTGKISAQVLYRYETIEESLRLESDKLSPLYKISVVRSQRGTHVVTGIEWGANLVAVLRRRKILQDKQSTLEMEIILKNDIKKLTCTNPIKSNDTLNSSISFYSDIPNKFKDPQTMTEVQGILNGAYKLIENTVGEKGVPLTYTLTPISYFEQFLNFNTNHSSEPTHVQDWTLDEVIDIFENIYATHNHLNELHSQMESQKSCVLPKTRHTFSKLYRNFLKSKSIFEADLRQVLLQVRSGLTPDDELSNTAEKYLDDPYSPHNIETKLKEFTPVFEKIKFCSTYEANYVGVKYFTSPSELNSAIYTNAHKIIYIIYQKAEFIQTNTGHFKQNLITFVNALNKPSNKLFVADCDFYFPDCESSNRTVVKQLIGGQVKVEDVLAEIQKLTLSLVPVYEMKAVGRFARIGELYDIRTDTFLGSSILVLNHSANLTISKDNAKSETYNVISETFQDRCRALGVGPEQQFNILAGLFPLARSGLYLSHTERKNTMISNVHFIRSIVNTQLTHTEELDIFSSELAGALNVKGNEISYATHFVSSIDYGLNSIISVEDVALKSNLSGFTYSPFTNNDGDTVCLTQCVFDLKLIFQNARNGNKSTNGIETAHRLLNSSICNCPQTQNNTSHFRFKVYSDNQAMSSQPMLLHNIQQLKNYLEKTVVAQQFSLDPSQRKPVNYVLQPLENLKTSIGFYSSGNKFSKLSATPEEDINKMEQILQNVEVAQIQLDNMADKLNRYPECTTDQDLILFREIQNDFQITLGSVKTNFRNFVLKLRGSSPQIINETIKSYLNKIKSKNYFEDGLHFRKLQKMDQYEEKLRFYLQIRQLNVSYLGRKTEFGSFRQIFKMSNNRSSQLTYFLYYKPEWTRNQSEDWGRSSQIFFGPLMNHLNATTWKFCVVNCDFNHPYCNNMTRPVIHEYFNAQLSSEDFILSSGQNRVSVDRQIRDMNVTIFQLTDLIASQVKNNTAANLKLEANLNTVSSRASDNNKSIELNKIQQDLIAKEVGNNTAANIKLEFNLSQIQDVASNNSKYIAENKRLINATNSRVTNNTQVNLKIIGNIDLIAMKVENNTAANLNLESNSMAAGAMIQSNNVTLQKTMKDLSKTNSEVLNNTRTNTLLQQKLDTVSSRVSDNNQRIDLNKIEQDFIAMGVENNTAANLKLKSNLMTAGAWIQSNNVTLQRTVEDLSKTNLNVINNTITNTLLQQQLDTLRSRSFINNKSIELNKIQQDLIAMEVKNNTAANLNLEFNLGQIQAVASNNSNHITENKRLIDATDSRVTNNTRVNLKIIGNIDLLGMEVENNTAANLKLKSNLLAAGAWIQRNNVTLQKTMEDLSNTNLKVLNNTRINTLLQQQLDIVSSRASINNKSIELNKLQQDLIAVEVKNNTAANLELKLNLDQIQDIASNNSNDIAEHKRLIETTEALIQSNTITMQETMKGLNETRLETRNISSTSVGLQQSLDNLVRTFSTCEFKKPRRAVSLDCNDPIQIPGFPSARSSIVVSYRPNALSAVDCLWPVNSTFNNTKYSIKVRVKLLCTEFESSSNSIAALTWNSDSDNNLASHDLQDYIAYGSGEWVHELYLRFASTGDFSLGNSFVVQIELMQAGIWAAKAYDSHVSFSTAVGTGTFGPYQNHVLTSVAILKREKTIKSTITVNYVDSQGNGTVCNNYDSLLVYEISWRHQPKKLATLCNKIGSPTSFSTHHSILAFYRTHLSTTGRGFGISWK